MISENRKELGTMAFEEFFNPDGTFAEDEAYVLRRLQEEDDGLNQEVIKEFADRYIRVFEIRI